VPGPGTGSAASFRDGERSTRSDGYSDMRGKTFSIIVAVSTTIYAVGCFFFFNQPFQGFTALIVGVLAAAVPLYLEHDRSETLNAAKVAQYLRDSLPAARDESVYASRIRKIRDELEGIEKGELGLTVVELGQFAEQRMREEAEAGHPLSYCATHIVDSNAAHDVWGSDVSTYPWLKSYVSAQRNFLDCRGQIVRVFLFDPHWLSSSLEAAKRLLRNHDSLFAGTAVAITTLAADRSAVARGAEDEFSILNQHEVFVWERAGQGQPDVFSGGLYVTRPERVSGRGGDSTSLDCAVGHADGSRLVNEPGSAASARSS